MEPKEPQKTEIICTSTSEKDKIDSDKQTNPELQKDQAKANPNNGMCVSFKELFLGTEDKSENNNTNKENTNQKEEINIIFRLFNIPQSSPDSFKNKDFKIRIRNDNNVSYIDNYSVKYTGKGVSKIDHSIIQTEKEISNKRPIFYYEANIINDGKEGDLSIGIGEKEITEKCIQLGLTTHSYGYHAKGKIYSNKKPSKYGENYNKGDIIGCGVDFINKSIFYTKNGKFLDYAFKDINIELNKGLFYPSICLHTLNQEVKLNFGIDNFKYDINSYYENVLIDKYKLLQKYNLKYDDMDFLIKEYLFHEGYMNTFKSMVMKGYDSKEEKLSTTANYNCINDGNNIITENDDDLDIEGNLNIEETKRRLSNDDLMEIETQEKDPELIDQIIELLPYNNNNSSSNSKDDKKEDKKKEDNKDKKQDDKADDKKKEENKSNKKEDTKDKDKDNKEKEQQKKDDKKKKAKEDNKDSKDNKDNKDNNIDTSSNKDKKEEDKKENGTEINTNTNNINAAVNNPRDIEKEKQDMQDFITLRSKILKYLSNREFDKAISLIKDKYMNIKEKEEICKKLFFNIIIMKYLILLRTEDNYLQCFELIDSLNKEYWDHYKILLFENNNYNKMSYVSLQTLATLLSQPDILNSDYSFYLSDNQINLILQQINSCLFELINLSPLSNLTKINIQLDYMNELYYKIYNCNQELNLK